MIILWPVIAYLIFLAFMSIVGLIQAALFSLGQRLFPRKDTHAHYPRAV